jgi:hypothetical protein
VKVVRLTLGSKRNRNVWDTLKCLVDDLITTSAVAGAIR